MFQAGSITGTITLDEEPAVQALRATEAAAKGMKNNVARDVEGAAAAGSKSFKGMFTSLREQFGKHSAGGQAFEMLAGAGVMAGVGIAARQLADFGQKTGEMSLKYRMGAASARELSSEVVRSVPVFGDLVKAVDGVAEAFTGAEAAEARQARAIHATSDAQKEAFDRFWRRRQQSLDQIRTLGEEEDAIKKLGDEYRRAGEAAGMREPAKSYAAIGAQVSDTYQAGLKGAGVDDAARAKALGNLNGAKAEEAQRASLENLFGAQARDRLARQGDLAPGWSVKNGQPAFGDAEGNAGNIATAQAEFDRIEAGRAKLAKDRDAAIAMGRKKVDSEADAQFWNERKKQEADDRDRLRTAGAELMRGLRTPQEEAIDKIKEARDLYNSGTIDAKSLGRSISENGPTALGGSGMDNRARYAPFEEVFGPRTVTAADVGRPDNPLADMAGKQLESQKNSEEALKVIAEAVKTMAKSQGSGMTAVIGNIGGAP